MLSFEYKRAGSLSEALSLLSSRANSHVLAGGTNLLLRIKHRQLKPALLIAINRIEDLKLISQDQGFIRIGAGVKINQLLESPVLIQNAPLLLEAAKEMGSPEVRNMATIGGNICSMKINCGTCGLPGCQTMSGGGVQPCRYASFADLITPLVAMNAGVLLTSNKGNRHVQLIELVEGQAALKPNEILQEVIIQVQENNRWGYTRLVTAKGMGVTVISVAVVLGNHLDRPRLTIAVGGSLEKTVVFRMEVSQQIDDSSLQEMVNAVSPQLLFKEHIKMSPGYRQRMAGLLIKQAIKQAMEVSPV